MNDINLVFQKYYFENWRLVFYAARNILRVKEAAEDVTNDVFVNLYKQMLTREIPEEKVKAWLVVSAKRMAYNYLRNNKRLVPLDIDIPGSDSFQRIDNSLFVNDMLNRLHKRSKRWFDITAKYYLLGMSTAELAEEYHCSEQAIRNTLQRARDYLRSEYKTTDVSILFFMLLTIRINYILTFLDINKLLD
ncbi:MAG: sigma-70 family RNA polymerase sigma factor [Eubacteriales bacterium]|nr:sigma-70 family RNA polymerase sigma factor [Eubacteriales bacterium]